MPFKKDHQDTYYLPCPQKKCTEKIYTGKWKHGSHPVPEVLKPHHERYIADAKGTEKTADNPKGDQGLAGKVKNAEEAFGYELGKHLSQKK